MLPRRVTGPYGVRNLAGKAVPVGSPGKGVSVESGCLKQQPKEGGRLHLKLNITTRPIENKYRKGKLKRTLQREFNSL